MRLTVINLEAARFERGLRAPGRRARKQEGKADHHSTALAPQFT
jgi:hypothetical protein